jgi:MinD superfamily P-loop ATPase
VVINKTDINSAHGDKIAAFYREQGIELVGRIPYDDVVTEAMVQDVPVTAFKDGAVTAGLKHVWRRVRDWLVH